jgi:hypothetical protein
MLKGKLSLKLNNQYTVPTNKIAMNRDEAEGLTL